MITKTLMVEDELTTAELAYLDARKTIIADLKSSSLYKDFIYDSAGTLIKLEHYVDSTKAVKKYSSDYNYVNGTLTSIVITRVADSFVIAKNFIYDGSTLKNIEATE